jgi:hypothetical protein
VLGRSTQALAGIGATMTIDFMRHFLLWCLGFSYSVLILWFLVFVLARNWLFRLHTRWFKLSDETFDRIHYASMAIYKVGILLFNLVPYAALCVMRNSAS